MDSSPPTPASGALSPPAAPPAPLATGRWSNEEHDLFVRGLELHGKEWKRIALLVRTRTVVQIRTHAQKYFQKLAKAKASAGETVNAELISTSTTTAPTAVGEYKRLESVARRRAAAAPLRREATATPVSTKRAASTQSRSRNRAVDTSLLKIRSTKQAAARRARGGRRASPHAVPTTAVHPQQQPLATPHTGRAEEHAALETFAFAPVAEEDHFAVEASRLERDWTLSRELYNREEEDLAAAESCRAAETDTPPTPVAPSEWFNTSLKLDGDLDALVREWASGVRLWTA